MKQDAATRLSGKQDGASTFKVPFNKPHLTGCELEYIEQALSAGHLSACGPFTSSCQSILEDLLAAKKAFLTTSGSTALDMAALVADIKPGDEVIMPSFTFVTTASAFALRGAVPVFVDIRSDTLNIDENLIEPAITSKTKAIVVVHYAGISCEMEAIADIAREHDLIVIEDAAHAILARYRGRPLGSLGQISTLSFHAMKNVVAGEGGAVLVTDAALVERAHLIWDKGTNKRDFVTGKIDKYTWHEVSTSFAPGEITAAFLLAQLEQCQELIVRRLSIWESYHAGLDDLERKGHLRRPTVPSGAEHNGHIYYLLLSSQEDRSRFISHLASSGIEALFHFSPLHSSSAGRRVGRASKELIRTEELSSRLVRLPLWIDMDEESVDYVIDVVHEFFGASKPV